MGFDSRRSLPAVVLWAASIAIACGHATTASPAAPDAAGGGRLRVLTWNVHQGYSWSKKHVNNEQIALIASLEPDVVALQELAEWDNDMPGMYRDGLSKRTGRPWTMHYEADIPGAERRLRQGSGIATALPVEQEQNIHVGDPSRPQDQVRNRTVVRLRLNVGGRDVEVATVHLDHLDGVNRRAQLDQTQAWLNGGSALRIVTGDFNAYPDDPQTFGGWQSQYADAWVSPANLNRGDPGYTVGLHVPNKKPGRVDYQWFTGLEPVAVRLIDTELSDHAALLVDWAVPGS